MANAIDISNSPCVVGTIMHDNHPCPYQVRRAFYRLAGAFLRSPDQATARVLLAMCSTYPGLVRQCRHDTMSRLLAASGYVRAETDRAA